MKTLLVVGSLCSVLAAQADLAQSAPAIESAVESPQTSSANKKTGSTLHVHPASIRIDSTADRPRIVVIETDHEGVTRDVSTQAKFSIEAIARVTDRQRLEARKNGKAELLVTYGGLKVRVPVEIVGASIDAEVSFKNEVIPALTRIGCNTGSCHGAKVGKNGFRLSLFGYFPTKDHEWLTRELRGRRVNKSDPDESLLLLKPTAQVKHKGKKVLEKGSAHYKTLRRWVEAGAKNDVGTASELVGVTLEPTELVMAKVDASVQLLVTARYADGSTRDVTDDAILSSSNTSAAIVDAEGTVIAKGRGETSVLVRYGSFAEASQVIVVPGNIKVSWPDIKPVNYIDEGVFDKLRRLRLTPAKLCDDRTFVRRVYLDIVGSLPTVAAVAAFEADTGKEKRKRLVDELLEREAFADVWSTAWAEILRVEERTLRRKGMVAYARYLRDAFRNHVPFDQLVANLLTANGGSFEVPATNFFVTTRDTKIVAENVAQCFMGVRMQCAQCHDHPFERWTMDDYYGFAGFFSQISRKRGEDAREWIVFNRGEGSIINPRTRRAGAPRFLGGEEPKIAAGEDRRQVVAKWLTDPSNPYFATSVADRIWSRFFGRGIVEPVDDVRVSNPPSHPRLRQELGKHFADYGFDYRALIRDICSSHTYQQAVHPDAPPVAAYASVNTRRMTAEQLSDAISQVAGVSAAFTGVPAGGSATLAVGGRSGSRFLELFGRPLRQSACSCERRNEPTLNQVLHLINGETIEKKVGKSGGRLDRHLLAKRDDAFILKDLYLSAYSRLPLESEKKLIMGSLAKAGEKGRRTAWEDIFWAVLNSKEFLFQH